MCLGTTMEEYAYNSQGSYCTLVWCVWVQQYGFYLCTCTKECFYRWNHTRLSAVECSKTGSCIPTTIVACHVHSHTCCRMAGQLIAAYSLKGVSLGSCAIPSFVPRPRPTFERAWEWGYLVTCPPAHNKRKWTWIQSYLVGRIIVYTTVLVQIYNLCHIATSGLMYYSWIWP